jgi:hypothetical protein
MSLYDPYAGLDYTLDPDAPGPISSPARTEQQIAASRINGSKSRGPVTPEGKAISSQNNLRHGMLAKAILLEGESLEIFREFMHFLEATFQPVGLIENAFIETMALSKWRQMRLLAMERAGFNHQIAKETELDPATCAFLAFTTLAEQSRVVELMYRYDARCDNQYDRALTRLFEAQKRRREN